jgi:diadenosine tetraphosphate (Ap4A) HIT family hydrolase
MNQTAACSLCSQIAGRPENDLIAGMLTGQPYVRRVILESASFVLLPSLGPLAPGHVLLCPRRHVKSLAALGSERDEEYEAVYRQTVHLLESIYGGYVHLFEHGMAARGTRTVCTVDHAHLHFVPLPRPLEASMILNGWVAYDGSLAELRHATRGEAYVSFESPVGVRGILPDEAGRIESQLMRKIIAKALGKERIWNWRDYPNAALADKIWRQTTRHLVHRPAETMT